MMAKTPSRKADMPAPVVEQDTADDARQATLEKKYRASRTAFNSWETAQIRTDQHLYTALGRLAEFAAAVGNDHQTLIEFAAARGVRATKASTPYTVTARLIVADRKKTNKYATVLHLAARRGIEPTEDRIAEFIKAEGGIEACLRSFRELPREGGPAKGGGRPSAFGKAMEMSALSNRHHGGDRLHPAANGLSAGSGHIMIRHRRSDRMTLTGPPDRSGDTCVPCRQAKNAIRYAAF